MQNEQLSVKRESSNKTLDDEYLEYLTEFLSKYDVNEFNSKIDKKPNYDLLVKTLTNSYLIEMEKHKSLSQRIWNSFSTFTVHPNTTVNDYLTNTALNISVNKSIASDWNKVGSQLWVSLLKQPEVKS